MACSIISQICDRSLNRTNKELRINPIPIDKTNNSTINKKNKGDTTLNSAWVNHMKIKTTIKFKENVIKEVIPPEITKTILGK
jgi:hypothetical protein